MSPAWLWMLVSVLFMQLSAAQRENFSPTDSEILAAPKGLLGDRRPVLYTGDFGSCMENSAITINRFDAAYYADNMTVVFNIDGQTTLVDENLMIHLTVNAYGESRFTLVFNPCNANLPSLCPASVNVNISAAYAIPVSTSDVAGIPKIAFHVPDFEGRADLRIFSNSTRSQVACVTALITNGSSFSHPKIISPILAGLAIIVCLASFIAAISGNGVTSSRTLYAHSLSGYAVFSCYHSIYFTGALSVNFPSVLIAFWSNFAWAAGIISNESMQSSLNSFTRKSARSANANSSVDDLGLSRELYSISKRSFRFGEHQKEGLPVPGNFSGFPATLAESELASTNAFMTAFVWVLVLFVIIAIFIGGFKLILDSITIMGLEKTRLQVFRDNWLAFLRLTLLRTAFITFFPIVLLSTFQFTLKEPGPQGIAGIVLVNMVVGIFTAVTYAYLHRWRGGKFQLVRESRMISLEPKNLRQRSYLGGNYRLKHIKNGYQSMKRTFLSAGLDGYLQDSGDAGGGFLGLGFFVFGLLAIEIIAFGLAAFASPFQSVRLNALMIYLFGIMKIATLAIIAALIMNPGLNRITVTVLGIIVIVFQGLTTFAVIIFSAVNVYTTYFGIAPPRSHIKPKKLIPAREKYLVHIKARSIDIDPPPKVAAASPKPIAPSFTVTDFRRYPKIDDEYDDQVGSLFSGSSRRGTPNALSGARPSRQVWSTSPRWPIEDMPSVPLTSSRTDWPLLDGPPKPIRDDFGKETSSHEARDMQSFESDVHTFSQKD